jgi:hypothetical protein
MSRSGSCAGAATRTWCCYARTWPRRQKSRHTRNPTSSSRLPGALPSRYADRQCPGELRHEPPRRSLPPPRRSRLCRRSPRGGLRHGSDTFLDQVPSIPQSYTSPLVTVHLSGNIRIQLRPILLWLLGPLPSKPCPDLYILNNLHCHPS